MTTTTEQPRTWRAECLFDLSAHYLAELLNLVCVLELAREAWVSGTCSTERLRRACESFLYAADRIRTDVLKERLVFRSREDHGLVYSDTDVSLEGDEADEGAEGGGQRAYRVNSPIADINALAGDYLIHRPKHPSRPLVLHRTLTPEAVCLDGEDERLELIGGSIPVERSGEE
jgi:hypothetical protein